MEDGGLSTSSPMDMAGLEEMVRHYENEASGRPAEDHAYDAQAKYTSTSLGSDEGGGLVKIIQDTEAPADSGARPKTLAAPMPTLSQTLKEERQKEGSIRTPSKPSNAGYFTSPSPNRNGRSIRSGKKKKTKSPFPKGAEVLGLQQGYKNARQMTWERQNNDKWMKRNIYNMKSNINRFETANAKEQKRIKRARQLKYKLLHRDSVERCHAAYVALSKNNHTNFSQYILTFVKKGPKQRRQFFKKANHVISEYSVEGIQRFRFWFEIILHTESFDTLERLFPIMLQKLFIRNHHLAADAEILLMAYVERRLVTQEEVYDSQKTMVLLRYLYELEVVTSKVVRRWKLGMLDEVEASKLQCVPGLSFPSGQLTIARSKVAGFLEWTDAVEKESLDKKLRGRDKRKMKKKGAVETPFGSLPTPPWAKGMVKDQNAAAKKKS